MYVHNEDPNRITILEERLPEAKHALGKLVKKAHRYGNDDITYTVCNRRMIEVTRENWDGTLSKVKVPYVDLLIEGSAPTFGDYTFLAAVERTQHGNFVDTVPGAEVDPRFRHTDGHCDHCKTQRQRNLVYIVLNNTTGEQIQVGRTCLRDALGIDDPRKIANRFSFYRSFSELSDDQAGYSNFEWAETTLSLLGLAAVCVRLFGWASKSQAQFDDNVTATASYVSLAMTPAHRVNKLDRADWQKIHNAYSEDDITLAEQVLAWVRDEAEIVNGNEYMSNLKVACAADIITDPKRIGLVISAISAYSRAQERELRRTREYEAKKASAHVGELKERLRDLKVTKTESRNLGYGMYGETILTTFVDEQGNIFKWFSGNGSMLNNGEQAIIDATVKKHGEYNGVQETILTRVKVK